MLLFNSLERRVIKARTDSAEANKLIAEYQPFVAKTVHEHIGRFVAQEDSDEFSTALSAFHEAVMAYDSAKGKFLPFAARIIRLRLIDLYRRQHRRPASVSLDAALELDDRDLSANQAFQEYELLNENQQRRYEILSLTDELIQWGITFSQLADHSPKQDALRSIYHGVVKQIMESEELLTRLRETRKLPMKEIEGLTGIDRKRLDRGRIYMIACILILSGDYQFLKEYVKWK